MAVNYSQNAETNRSNSEARQYVDNLLRNGDVEEKKESKMQLPPWYNEELCKKGQKAFFDFRFIVTSGMFTGLVAVIAIPSILKVLVSTKNSSSPITAYKRYIRTILHVATWHSYTFRPGTKSWQSLLMVRKAHMRSSKYSTKNQTGIISQKDLALTQFGLLGFVMLDAENYGIKDPDYFEGTVHLWRVIGFMLGIKDEFNLCSESWATTRPRLLIIRDEIFKPALEKPSPKFNEMFKALVDGLWAYDPTLSMGSFLFFTKRMAKCEGYEYFDSDFPNRKRIQNPGTKLYYEDLNWKDKFSVSYGLFLSEKLHHFNMIRKYLNFRVWLDLKINEYFPWLPIILFGPRTAFVKIFVADKPNELHID